ncbi:MAG: CynX/NimT family MFS transporter [Thermodesulfobacteriota bacterium]
MEPYQSGYRWVILSLLWLLYVAFGLVNRAIAPLVTPILEDLHLSYTQMGLILGSWQLTYIFVAMISGSVIDKWGVRSSLLAGTVIIGLSSALRYFPKEFWSMLGSVALFGVGGSLISIGCPKAIAAWFRGKSRGTAVGIYLTGPWVGGIFSLTFTNSLVMPLTGHSWRLTFLVYGALTFTMASLWWFLGRNTEGEVSHEDTGIFTVFARLIKVRNVQLVLIMALLTFAISHGFTNWLPKILETSGFSPASAGILASIPIAAGIPPRLIFPSLVPPKSRKGFLSWSALFTIVTLVLSMTTSGHVQIAGLVLFGIINACFFPILTLILMEIPEVGSRYLGAAAGMFFTIAEIGGCTGPWLTGILVDVTGSFLAGMFFFSGLSLATFFLALLLRI